MCVRTIWENITKYVSPVSHLQNWWRWFWRNRSMPVGQPELERKNGQESLGTLNPKIGKRWMQRIVTWGCCYYCMSWYPQCTSFIHQFRSWNWCHGYQRNRKGYRRNWPSMPRTVVNYTRSMGGLSLAVQTREYYRIRWTSKKWWKRVLYFVLNVAVVNSFVHYDKTNRLAHISHWNG